MKKLTELIQEEGNRNNSLKKALNEGKFPSEDIARQVGSEELYKIATSTIEFNYRTNLEILKSNHHLVQLMKRYVSECESGDSVPECDLGMIKGMIQSYTKETDEITQQLVNQQIRGYEASW